MRRWIALAAASLVLAVSACSGGSSGSTEFSDKPVTLRFTWWGADARHQRTQQVIDLFHKEHPNITIKGEFKDWNGYWDSLATTVAANDAPDIIQMDELYLASYADRGALLDLKTQGEHLKLDGIDPKALATGAIDGKQYALPVGLASQSLVANTDLFTKYGVPLPNDDTWTWDDLWALAAKFSAVSGGKVVGLQSYGMDGGGLGLLARQQGNSIYDDAGQKVVVKPEIVANFFEEGAKLSKEGAIPKPGLLIEQASNTLDQSGTGTNTAALGFWWNTQLTSLTKASGQHLKLLKLPGESTSQKPGAYYKPSMFWSISSRSKHPAEAALFVDFLANSKEAGDILLTDRGVPANKAVLTAITPKLGSTDKAAADYLSTIKVSDPPRVTPNGGSSIDDIIRRHAEDVLFGRQPADKAATAFITELQKEIDSAS
jgi:multiple sugar transport system substrate-binding protein